MRRRKRVGVLSLCVGTMLSLQAPLTGLAASPEFARSAEEWERLRDNVLEYEELEDLIHEYNVTTQNNQYTASSMGSDVKLSELVGEQLEDAQKLYEGVSNATTESERINAEFAARQKELGVLRTYDGMEDSDSVRWKNARTEGLLVQEAQNTMNSYYQLKQQLIAAEKGKELLEAQLHSVQTRMSVNMATQAEVLAAQQSLQNSEAQILSLNSEIESARQKLIIMTGWKQGENPEIREIPEVDPGRIAVMDLNQDIQTALDNDYQLKMDKHKEARVPSQDYRKAYGLTVATDKEQIAAELNNAYQAVQQAKTAYDEAVLDLNVAAKNLATASTQYNLGSISLLEYRQKDSEHVTAQTGLEIKKLELLKAVEAYDWIVKGVR